MALGTHVSLRSRLPTRSEQKRGAVVQLRRGLHDRMERQGELRANGEPATFSGSHRSLLTEVMLARGVEQVTLRGVPLLMIYFFRLCFLYLPFLSFGNSFRTRSMSRRVQR